ncbi:leucine zipper containing transcription factor lzf1 [Anaeramoeba ignava]|uniref:Leucine zipper containing transcription factor lzf1 n=1 Tax=Anaeramoeba ignava TaxID=1746090 RepID=A0A9Q0R848_ANAIG|nr:leucine zipper containing transcription factor lzf1 [Anaeramoeba ignava]
MKINQKIIFILLKIKKQNSKSQQSNPSILLNSEGLKCLLTFDRYKIVIGEIRLKSQKYMKGSLVKTSITGEYPFILEQIQTARENIKLALNEIGQISSKKRFGAGFSARIIQNTFRFISQAKNAMGIWSFYTLPQNTQQFEHFYPLLPKEFMINIYIQNNSLKVKGRVIRFTQQKTAIREPFGNQSLVGMFFKFDDKLVEVIDEISCEKELPKLSKFNITLAKAFETCRCLVSNQETIISVNENN